MPYGQISANRNPVGLEIVIRQKGQRSKWAILALCPFWPFVPLSLLALCPFGILALWPFGKNPADRVNKATKYQRDKVTKQKQAQLAISVPYFRSNHS